MRIDSKKLESMISKNPTPAAIKMTSITESTTNLII